MFPLSPLETSHLNHLDLKVPYYTVCHLFYTAVRGPTTVYSKCIALNSSVVHGEQAVSVPAPLNAKERHLSTPALPATHPSQGEDAAYARRSMG